ncbi:uncharacterized protein K441DRAFT_186449 [Cenococcum geophilum 1.58]|uniref:uncharacterized protein n=1 Tax=Cenococcum geophilum 1.58 TaxID=794803 RepID=UPI00358E9F5A|nr:hypothetical protein K441DRAFT_186449 [Cenococcum geophilum 1.58]
MDEQSIDTGIETTASTSVPMPAPLPAPTSQIPPGPHFIAPHLGRQGTGSTSSSIPFSQVPTGSWDTYIHGSCPRCHHWHNRVTLRVSRNPGVFNGIRCEKCAHKWFGIGGNSTHTSLASQETTDNFDENSSVVRGLLLQTMRDMSAVGSPTLAIVQEDPSGATSPLSRHSSSRHHPGPSPAPPAPTDIQMANSPTTILRVPQEGNITVLDSRSHSTPSVHETHGATQIQTKPSNNSSQGPRKNKRNFFTKIIIRNIKNKLDKWRDRLQRGKRRSAQNPPAAVKPADPTPMQETRPMSPRQTSPVEAQQPEDNLPEGTPPAAIPDRTVTEPPETHRRTVLEFRDELPRLTHRERIARLRRTLTEQQTCTCNNNTCSCSCRQRLLPSSSVVPDNPLADTASVYPSHPSEESGPWFNDLLFIGSRFEMPPAQPHRYSNGTTLSGITAVSGDSSRSMTVTSGHDQNTRARSLPGDLRTRMASPPRPSNLRLQTDLDQEGHDTSRGSMETGLTDEEEPVQQGIDGERTPTQDNLLTNGSENPSHGVVDGERSSTHQMLNGTDGSISSDGETTSAQGRASMDDEPDMNGERTPTDQRNHT